jgi:hypothetical protein
MVEFVQGVGMVYFHFPFSTHAPIPICKATLLFGTKPSGAGQACSWQQRIELRNSCAKNNLEKELDIYPIISYLYYN